MSDYLSVLLIMMVIGLLLLTPAAYFGGKTALIITWIILTAFSCFVLMYGMALGKSFANSSSPTTFNVEILLLFLSFAALYAFIGYGAFCFSQMAHGVAGYKLKWLVCTLILVGYPSFLLARETYSAYTTKVKNYKTEVIIAHPIDFPIQIDQLRFFNSETNQSSIPYSRFLETDRELSRIEGLNYENEDMQSQRYYRKLAATLIPITFNAFELSWYSVLEHRFYKDVFPLDQKKLKVSKTYEGQMLISDMLINILPNGHVDLLKHSYSNYSHIAPYYDVAFTDVEGQSQEAIWELFTPIGKPEEHKENLKRDFAELEANTRTLLTPEEILSFRRVYPYGMTIEINEKPNEINELQEIKIIDFYLNQYTRQVDSLKVISTKPLPSYIEIKLLNDKDERRRIAIAFDKKALFNAYNTFTEIYKDAVYFDISVDIEDLSLSEITLKSKEAKTILQDYRIYER
ncbi:hypothetical protein [Tamlana sp. I1]|uniref:hypothetical protein n=1 Tax=Tamlana sp. I1 TaxID=2762061 RepID=UPI0018903AA3|nr:hypothetical protein [Tamlana sp. I1]